MSELTQRQQQYQAQKEREEEEQRVLDEARAKSLLEFEAQYGVSQLVTDEDKARRLAASRALAEKMLREVEEWDSDPELQEAIKAREQQEEKAEARKRDILKAIVEEGKAKVQTPEEAMRDYTRKLWVNLVGKCTDTSNKHYRHWGGAGVRMCDAWVESFEAFVSGVGLCPSPQYELQRIHLNHPHPDTGELNPNFEPGNAMWKERIVRRKQSEDDVHAGGRPRNAARVRVPYEGEMVTLSELAERTGVKKSTILARYAAGKSVEQMIVPVRLASRGKAWVFDGLKDENGVSQVVTLKKLCQVSGIPYATARARLDKGMPLMMALGPKKEKQTVEERRYKQRAHYHAKKAKKGGNDAN